MASVGVVGLGYVGLPLAVQAAEKGFDVVGVDVDPELVDLVNERRSPYVNDERFERAIGRLGRNSLRATTDYEALGDVDTIVICVPTPTDDNIPDISYVMKAAAQVGSQLKKGQLVSLESTVSPGITRDEVLPVLESVSHLKVGEDFCLAHCPERIDPGNEKFYVGNLNRVVGGVTPECTERAVTFYQGLIDAEIIPLGSTEEAEFVKSWENSHRNVMIALANSAAIICDAVGMDIDNVMRGLQSKVDQFDLKLATPGIGPGGHCIPEDIHYVIKKARQNGVDTRFLDDAAELNDHMPQHAVQHLRNIIEGQGESFTDIRVALLGLAYKPNISDARRSPSVEVGYQLLRRAKGVIVHDPYIRSTEMVKGAVSAETIDEALAQADAVFVGTAHAAYLKALTPKKLKQYGIRYVLDGRNCLDSEPIKQAGIHYHGIGRS